MENIKKYLELLDKRTVLINSKKNKKEENDLRIKKITDALLSFSEIKKMLALFSWIIFFLFISTYCLSNFFDITYSTVSLVNLFAFFYFVYIFFCFLLYHHCIFFIHKNGGQKKIKQECEKIEKYNIEYKSKITDIKEELNHTYDLIDKNDILEYLEQHKQIDDEIYDIMNNRLNNILTIKKNNLKENLILKKISEIEELENFEKRNILVTN